MDESPRILRSRSSSESSGEDRPMQGLAATEGKEVTRGPSFIFKSVKDGDLEPAANPPSSSSDRPSTTQGAPVVKEKSKGPAFFDEISSSSEEQEQGDKGGKAVDGEKEKLPSAAELLGPPVAPLAHTSRKSLHSMTFAELQELRQLNFSGDDGTDANAQPGEKKEPVDTSGDQQGKHAATGLNGKSSPRTADPEDVLDLILKEYDLDQAKSAAQFKQPSSKDVAPGSDPVSSKKPSATPPSDGSQKGDKPGSTGRASSTKALPAPKSKMEDAAPTGSSKPKADSTSTVSIPTAQPSNPPAPPSHPAPTASSVSTPHAQPTSPGTPSLRLDAFTPISSGDKRSVRKDPDSDDENAVTIDGSRPSRPAKTKKSPRSDKSPKTKRHSQRVPTLTLKPRYVPTTRKGNTNSRSTPTLEQCENLLQLLERGCDESLRAHLLGALAGMVFGLPEKDRGDLLDRAWRQARLLLDDAQLRQWAGQVFAAYAKARSDDSDASDSDQAASALARAKAEFTSLKSSLKEYQNKKQWNAWAQELANKKLDSQIRLMAMAQTMESINGLGNDADISKAVAPWKEKLGSKLLVLAFFQSSVCPGGARLRSLIDHTAAAVLRGVLVGDAQAVTDFKALMKDADIANGLEQVLSQCVDELARQQAQPATGGANPGPATTADASGVTNTTAAPRRAVPAEDTILDIVQELLLLEGPGGQGDSSSPVATNLPDGAVCRLIGVIAFDREAALQAIGSAAYDDVVTFIHEVCVRTLAPLSCEALLTQGARGAVGMQETPLLHHLMANGDMQVARSYLRKLIGSGMSMPDLRKMLYARDSSGVTALEAAMKMGQARNVERYIDFVAGLAELKSFDKMELFAARRSNNMPALQGAIGSKGQPVRDAVHAYARSVLNFSGGDTRDLIGILSDADDDGNPALRIALMKDDAGVVSGLVQAICEAETISAAEKSALLFGQMEGTGTVADFMEKALADYYGAVKNKYQEKFSGKAIPKESETGIFGMKASYFPKTEGDPFARGCDKKTVAEKLKWTRARENSQHAMMSMFTEDERRELKKRGQDLMARARTKAISAFHMALRKGHAQSVASYIEGVLAHAKSDKDLKPVDLLLASDAAGNPAFFNAMENDEHGGIAAYVSAVLSSKLDIQDKCRLLMATKKNGYTPLQIAMASGNFRAMHAYVDTVLKDPSLNGDEKQQLLLSVGGHHGKSARQTVVDLAQAKPETHGKCLQYFDAMVNESTLSFPIKNFLTQAYNNTAATSNKS